VPPRLASTTLPLQPNHNPPVLFNVGQRHGKSTRCMIPRVGNPVRYCY
jgi:hypothetical protein